MVTQTLGTLYGDGLSHLEATNEFYLGYGLPLNPQSVNFWGDFDHCLTIEYTEAGEWEIKRHLHVNVAHLPKDPKLAQEVGAAILQNPDLALKLEKWRVQRIERLKQSVARMQKALVTQAKHIKDLEQFSF